MIRSAGLLVSLVAAVLVAAFAMMLIERHRPRLRAARARLSPILPYLAVAMLVVGDLAVDALGSFGLADRVDETLQKASGMVTGPLYGGPTRVGQDKIVIVALDDVFLTEQGGGWPPSYETMALLTNNIAGADPQAVFLDLYYSSVHQVQGEPDVAGVELLAAVIGATQAPVLTGPIDPALPELKPLAGKVTQVALGFSDDQPYAYGLYGPGDRPLAATKLYEIVRRDAGKPLAAPLPRGSLALEWGFGASAWLGGRWADADNLCLASTAGARVASLARLVGRSVAPKLQADDPQADGLVVQCPYFDIVPASWVMNPDADLREHLRGKVVMVGSTLPWLSDQTDTPLLGRVPGVMAHAMALDNLMEFGAGATRYPREVFMGLDMGDVMQTFLLLVGFALVLVVHRAEGLKADDPLPFVVKSRIWLTIALISLAVACVCDWPMFKLMTAPLTGGACLEIWDQLQRTRLAKILQPQTEPS